MKFPGGKYTFLLISMTILFGLSFIASKNALRSLGVFQLIFGRYIFASVILTLILWQNRKSFFISKNDWKNFILLTAIEPVGYFIFETSGVRFTTPSNVSLIIATIPIFSLIFAFWILKEKATPGALMGILFSFLGVYLIVSFQPQSQLAPDPLLGNLLTLGAASSAGMYNVLCRKLSRKYSPLTITYYQTIVATVIFLPLAGFETYIRGNIQINSFIILNVLYLSLGCSVLAYFILNYTLSRLETSRVAIFANLIPVVTIIASWVVYRELMTLLQLSGALLIISGIYLTYRRQPESKPPTMVG